MRPSGRSAQQLRPIKLTRHYTKYAEGAVLVEFGETQVLCTATVEEGVPRFLKGKNKGWITAEYSMLPRSTHQRHPRESVKGKQGGRTLEIQRLIARSLRAAVDLTKLGEFTITLDCDVLQADGSTRTASITGACVALKDALETMRHQGKLKTDPMIGLVAAVSVGVVEGKSVCDLEYAEDCIAQTDMNLVMIKEGEESEEKIVEIQGTAESEPFRQTELLELLDLAYNGIKTIFEAQKKVLEK